jgi:hypothetical protein
VENVLGLLSPVICFVLHVLVYRLIPVAHRISRQKLTVFIVLAVTIGLGASVSLHTGFVSLLFGYVYFHWFNMSETARRIRILVTHVSGAADGTVYDPKVIFHQRIERLLEFGTLSRRGEMLVLHHGPLVWATRVIMLWRKLFYPED